VRRWAFNAIALVGNRDQNLEATVHALDLNKNDDDVFGAGMAALVSLTNEAETEGYLKQIGVDLDGAVLLAAAQQAPGYKGQLADRRVSIDSASPSELRLASVLVGLDKAPEHLFTINFPNSEVIGALSTHDDRQVAQYAAWSVSENSNLHLGHLGISPNEICEKGEDVRKYGYRLLAADDATAERYRELIAEASFDESGKAREGLAIGLLNAFCDGLEEITSEWISRESEQVVVDALLDHFVENSERCSAYKELARDAYREAGVGSILRAKLEARAEGKRIYSDFRRIGIDSANSDLFDPPMNLRGTSVTNIFNVNAQNVGVVAGESTLGGGVHQQVGDHAAQAQMELQRLLDILSKHETGQVHEGMQLANEAKEKPTKGAVEKLLSWMGVAKAGSSLLASGADDFAKIGEHLHKLLPHLPS
jgi:hypothetical protein